MEPYGDVRVDGPLQSDDSRWRTTATGSRLGSMSGAISSGQVGASELSSILADAIFLFLLLNS